MILRSKNWAALTALLLFGCPRTVTLAPVVEVPPRLPFAVADPVRRAVEAVNAASPDAPTWRVLGAHEAAGWVVEHYRLGRGLHLLLSVDDAASAFTHQIWFDARHLDVGAGDALLEQLRDPPGTEAMRALELAGGRSSSGMSRELGFFAVTMPSQIDDVDPLTVAVAHQARRLASARRATLAEPASATLRSAAERVEGRMARALEETLRAEDTGRPDAVLAPERLVFVVTGAVDRAALLAAIRRHHAEDGAPADEKRTLPKLRATAPAFPIEVKVPLDEGRALLLGWPIDPSDHDAALALEAAAHVLAGGRDSRLSSKLGRRSVSGIRARAPEGARTFEVMLLLAPSTSATIAASMVREEIRAVGEGDTTGKTLERARSVLLERTLKAASGLESRAELFAAALLLGGGLDAVDLRLAALEELEEPALRKATRSHLFGTPVQIIGVADQGEQ